VCLNTAKICKRTATETERNSFTDSSDRGPGSSHRQTRFGVEGTERANHHRLGVNEITERLHSTPIDPLTRPKLHSWAVGIFSRRCWAVALWRSPVRIDRFEFTHEALAACWVHMGCSSGGMRNMRTAEKTKDPQRPPSTTPGSVQHPSNPSNPSNI
jgi:hypothetical protein